MTITLAQATAFVSSVAGGTPELSSATAMINMAGHLLTSAHPWTWRRRAEASIDFVADQSYATLPADYGEVIAIDRANLDGFAFVGFDELLSLRYARSAITSGYVGAVVTVLPADNTVAPDAPRLELYPTPAANSTGALRMFYRAGWTEVTETTHALKIPGWMDLLFYETLRAVVLGIEEHDNAGVDQRAAAVFSGPVFATAAKRDTATSPEAGFLRNGVGQSTRGFDQIGDAEFPV